VTGRSDRAGHERKALGHRWSAGLILAGSLECTKAHWPVPADGDVMLSVIIKVQCRRGLGEGSSRPTLPCTYGRETTLWQWSAGGRCLASAKHPPLAPSRPGRHQQLAEAMLGVGKGALSTTCTSINIAARSSSSGQRRWEGACRPGPRHSMSSVQSRGTRPNRRSRSSHGDSLASFSCAAV